LACEATRKFVEEGLPNLDGFELFDENIRYDIVFPSGWKKAIEIEPYHLFIAPTGSAFDPACDRSPTEDWVGTVRAALGSASAETVGATTVTADSGCFTFGVTVPSACSLGTITKATATLFSTTGSRTVDSNGSVNTFTVGPRFSYRRYERFTPFAQALFGEVHASPVRISGCAGNSKLHAAWFG
jgi:hypothetical protein